MANPDGSGANGEEEKLANVYFTYSSLEDAYAATAANGGAKSGAGGAGGAAGKRPGSAVKRPGASAKVRGPRCLMCRSKAQLRDYNAGLWD